MVSKQGLSALILASSAVILGGCDRLEAAGETSRAKDPQPGAQVAGLPAETLSYEAIASGLAPARFQERTGATYKPSYNEDPAIPVQCWVETGYGTQNACKYCHTNYLAEHKHGNAFPIAEDQVLYSFPTPNLNRINWRNVTHPQELIARLQDEGLSIPQASGPANPTYVRSDNWREAYRRARPDGDVTWDNQAMAGNPLKLMPALNPDDLFPYRAPNPTQDGRHGYVDPEGFIRDRRNGYTGWRAVNFLPYAIFTPLTGSVSGIYIRLPARFMTHDGKTDVSVLHRNLELLERNIKNMPVERATYFGDASNTPVKKGFYPVGTEFAHPLHYVDLNADGESGATLDGVRGARGEDYEFPGTRSKRVKEVRYLYKWKDVSLTDIGEHEEMAGKVIGMEGQGWIDNKAGWILAAWIEDRQGRLRAQTTEELLQCLGCHSSVGNTVDTAWSLQRKLPGDLGWREMDYGEYSSAYPERTRLQDYMNAGVDKGELEYFFYSVVGADLFGNMPREIKEELAAYAAKQELAKRLALKHEPALIFDDEILKDTPEPKRRAILKERAAVMRDYAGARAYLYRDEKTGEGFIKGSVFYPSTETMLANIAGYRRIVLDQSYNLGKNTFGSQPDAIPFTFRSDGTVRDARNELIPAGGVIDSRPWGPDGVGTTPTGIARVNAAGEPVDAAGAPVDLEKTPERVSGHVSTGGTFDTRYNPILSPEVVKPGD